MSLSNLPDDLLLEILSDYIPSQCDLSALIRTSHRLYTLGKPHLYRLNARLYSSSVISWAVRNERLDILDYALDRGNADIEASDMINGRSPPLLVAAEVGYLDAVERLLDRGANVNRLNLCHETALSLAAQEGDLVVVEALLRYAGIEPDIPDSSHQTPLWWACSEGATTAKHEAIVRALLSHDQTEPNKGGDDGKTPLMAALIHGADTLVHSLLDDPRIDIEVRSNSGQKAIWAAARCKNVTNLGRLIYHGANPNEQVETGQTVLSTAASVGLEENVRLLLERGADPTIADGRGWQPLHWAAQDGRAAVVEVLLQDSRVDPAHASRVGTTPLHCASWDGQYDVLMLLLAREDIDVNCHDNAGWTPFIWAAFNGVESILQLFLADTRVNVNAKEGKGMSGLCYAAKKGHKAIVEALLEDARVDALIKANNGKTAIDIASENGREEVVKLLEERTNIKET